ncbi:serine hydrolase [Streptomyces sp. NPDC005813]|uniref:serine hydrolase n=1 Tax=Streptomyces sp. NPDC005813 TaxID=3155592 RepID=UPI0033C4E248
MDQATAVFSTKAVTAERAVTEAESAAPPAPASPGIVDSTDAADGSGEAGSAGDARLRAAVAAWVARTDEEAPAGAGEPAGAGTSAGAGEAGRDAADDADDAVNEGVDAGSDDAADAGIDADSGSGSGSEADSADADEASATGADADEEVADTAADTDTDSDTDTGTASDASGDEPRDDVVSGTAADETTADDTAESESESESESKSGADAVRQDGTAAPGRPMSAPEDSPEDSAVAEAPAIAKPAVDAEAPEDAKSPADAEAPADSTEEKAPAEAAASAGSAADARCSDGSGPSADAEAPADAGPGADAKSPADAKAPAEPPVDQPTAIFKAPRPPAVDQPTTMLKLGGGTKPGAGKTPAKPGDEPADKAPAKPADKPAAKPEPAVERTSRFVALKPLDEPAEAKPRRAEPAPGTANRPAADATAALPQVGPERTTQQPLPPKPPLDLLAELTNTPPPPQTPVRTIVRRVKIWTPLVLLLAVIFAVAQAVRPLPAASLALTADETYTFDGGSLDLPWPGQGQSAIEVEGVGSLGTDGKQTPAPIASVAKIMTAYVILQEHPLKGDESGEKITVDQQAEDESKLPDESTAAMSKGQQFTERQMLQMLMIPSGNNAARLLARWDSDNKSFVAKMNAAADELGMTNTTYTDPSGLQKTTVSTATDQLKLAKEVMQNDVFRGIVGMASAKIPGLDKPIYNNNDLLVQQVGVIGLKTGSSTPAGGNLVWAATKTVNGKTQTVYGAVMNQNAGTGKVWDSLHLALVNSQKLIDKVQKSLTTAKVVTKGQVVGYVDDQLGGRTPVVATKDMTAVGWPGLKTKLSIGEGKEAVPHSGKAGTVVGELTVGDGSSQAVKIPVALQSDLAEPGFGAKLTRVG